MPYQRWSTIIDNQLQIGAGTGTFGLRYFTDDGNGNPATEATSMYQGGLSVGTDINLGVSQITDGAELNLANNVDSSVFDTSQDNNFSTAPVTIRHVGLVDETGLTPAGTTGYVAFADLAEGSGVRDIPEQAFLRLQPSGTHWQFGAPGTIGTGQTSIFQAGLAWVLKGALSDYADSQAPSYDEAVFVVSVGSGSPVSEFTETQVQTLPMPAASVTVANEGTNVGLGIDITLNDGHFETGIPVNYVEMHLKDSGGSVTSDTLVAKDSNISETTSDPGFVTISNFKTAFN